MDRPRERYALLAPLLAFTKRALGRNQYLRMAGPQRCRLHLADQLFDLLLELVRRDEELRIEDHEQEPIILDLFPRQSRAGEQAHRLDRERQPVAFVPAEGQDATA